MARLAAVALALAASGVAHAQRPVLPVRDVAVEVEDRHAGFPASGVYAIARTADGRLWVGNDDGLVVRDARGWHEVTLPPRATYAQVRSLLAGDDGTLWVGTREGVLRYAGGAWTSYRLGDAAKPVYTLVRTRAIDGVERVVAGAIDGTWFFDGARFAPLTLPAGMPAYAAMVSADDSAAVPSLWVATIGGGVARLRAGAWTRWGPREGLDSIVQQAVALPAGAPYAAVAATSRGVVALAPDERRWSLLLPVSGGAMRVAAMRRAGQPPSATTVWAGGIGGELLRRAPDGVVDTLPLGLAGARTPIMTLAVLPDAESGAVLHVGFQGGILAALRPSIAGTLMREAFGRGAAVVTVAEDPRDGRLWAGTRTSLVALGEPRLASFLASPDQTTQWTLLPWRDAPGGPALLALTTRGVRLRAGGEWRSLGAPPAAEWWAMTLAHPPGRAAATPLVGGRHGLWFLERGRWLAWPDAPQSVRSLCASDDGAVFAGTGDGRVARWDGSRWTVREVGGAQRGPVYGVARIRHGDGSVATWAVGVPFGLWTITDDGDARAVPLDGIGILPTQMLALAQGRDGLVYVATTTGVIVMRPAARAGLLPEVVATLTDADGLPSPRTSNLAVASDGRVWVATVVGVGTIEPGFVAAPVPPAQLRVTARTVDGRPFAAGSALPANAPHLDVLLDLDVRHRAGDTRYLVELDRDTVGRWSPEPIVPLRGLAPGAHRVRAWARDWRGRLVGPVTAQFSVRRPAWRSPWALAGLGVLVLALMVVAERLRTTALRRRARESEASERRIAASEARFRALFDRGMDAQLLVRDRTIVAANAAAVVLLAGGDGTLAERPLADVLPPDDAPAERGEPESLEVQALDGTRIPVAARRVHVALEHESLLHVSLRDLREERRLAAERAALELQLRQSQRLEALGTLAGGVAHDFNNLITIIRTNADFAREPGPRDRELDAIVSASERARDLVRQILAFGRSDAATFVPVRPSRVLHELLPMLRASLPPTVRLALRDDAPDATVLGDATQLHQVALNLCTNAEHAMRATGGGVLELALDVVTVPDEATLAPHPTAPAGRYVRLSVRDGGAGMDEETQRRMFEPFFTTKAPGEGTGLGLSVLHGVVKAHRGSVSVASAPGSGTTFEILLPLHGAPASEPAAAVATAVASAVAAPPVAPPVAPRAVALVVDDEPQIAHVAARQLEAIGMATEVATNARDALAVLERRDDVRVLLTDLTMPGMSGDALAVAARTLRPGLGIVVMTGLAARLTAERAREAGVHRIVEKPFTREELQDAVASAVRGTPQGKR